jgi:hypothetical protein
MNNNEEFNFSHNPEDILRALLDSKQNETVVALAVPSIGAGIFITAVDEIFLNGEDTYVQLKKYDVTGFIFERNKLKLNEIVSVCPLNSKWQNPYIKSIVNDNVRMVEE